MTTRVFWEPEYVARFRCDGTACGSQCCRDWQIPVDDRARARYQSMPDTAARASILNAIRPGTETGAPAFANRSDGRCPFLRDDGLCQLQRDYGEAYLPGICWQYPRVLYRFPRFIECALTISCPVAAELVLGEAPLRFHRLRRPLPEGRPLLRPVPAVLALKSAVFSLQRAGIALLQDRRYPLDFRLAALSVLAARADEAARQTPAAERLAALCRDAGSPGFIETLRDASRSSFDLTESLRWRVRLMGEIYEHSFSPEKVDGIAAACAAFYPGFCRDVRQDFAPLLENYLVNEFFLRLYPFAFQGPFTRNVEIFLVTGKLVETALLAAYAQSGRLDRNGFVAILVRVVGHLDHNAMAMRRVGWAVDEVRAAGASVSGLMIDGGVP